MAIPTLYELNPDGEASGVLYRFCSQEDLALFIEAGESREPLAEGTSSRVDLLDDEVCAYCGTSLGPAVINPRATLAHLRQAIALNKADMTPGIFNYLNDIIDHALEEK